MITNKEKIINHLTSTSDASLTSASTSALLNITVPTANRLLYALYAGGALKRVRQSSNTPYIYYWHKHDLSSPQDKKPTLADITDLLSNSNTGLAIKDIMNQLNLTYASAYTLLEKGVSDKVLVKNRVSNLSKGRKSIYLLKSISHMENFSDIVSQAQKELLGCMESGDVSTITGAEYAARNKISKHLACVHLRTLHERGYLTRETCYSDKGYIYYIYHWYKKSSGDKDEYHPVQTGILQYMRKYPYIEMTALLTAEMFNISKGSALAHLKRLEEEEWLECVKVNGQNVFTFYGIQEAS